jgi:hypothetical protein
MRRNGAHVRHCQEFDKEPGKLNDMVLRTPGRRVDVARADREARRA